MSPPPAATIQSLTWEVPVRSLFIVAFIAAQLYLPLSYYLRPDPLPELREGHAGQGPVTLPEGSDPFDERFAWRMFSPVRMVKCRATLYDATDGVRKRVRVGQELHYLWVNLMRRARRPIFDQYARWRCPQMAEGGATPVLNAEVTCPLPGDLTVYPFDPNLNLCDPS